MEKGGNRRRRTEKEGGRGYARVKRNEPREIVGRDDRKAMTRRTFDGVSCSPLVRLNLSVVLPFFCFLFLFPFFSCFLILFLSPLSSILFIRFPPLSHIYFFFLPFSLFLFSFLWKTSTPYTPFDKAEK